MPAIKLFRSFALNVKDSKTLKPKVEDLIKKRRPTCLMILYLEPI